MSSCTPSSDGSKSSSPVTSNDISRPSKIPLFCLSPRNR
jgi:hypothetical protein